MKNLWESDRDLNLIKNQLNFIHKLRKPLKEEGWGQKFKFALSNLWTKPKATCKLKFSLKIEMQIWFVSICKKSKIVEIEMHKTIFFFKTCAVVM